MPLDRYLSEFTPLLGQVDRKEVQTLVDALVDAYQTEKWVFIIGNGGSGANASHLAEDLGKGTLSDFDNQKRLKVLSLTDNTPWILALGNDLGYDRVFVEQLKHYAAPGHLLISISGSGNSPNILKTVEWATANNLQTFAFTGYDGGKLRKMSQHSIHVPSFNMGMLESVHLVIFHYLLDTLRDKFKALALPAVSAR
jgi:D-sedoheptulose 7-phosphate isomerase